MIFWCSLVSGYIHIHILYYIVSSAKKAKKYPNTIMITSHYIDIIISLHKFTAQKSFVYREQRTYKQEPIHLKMKIRLGTLLFSLETRAWSIPFFAVNASTMYFITSIKPPSFFCAVFKRGKSCAPFENKHQRSNTKFCGREKWLIVENGVFCLSSNMNGYFCTHTF